jgi:hypothetical protein
MTIQGDRSVGVIRVGMTDNIQAHVLDFIMPADL